jgi:hypothetical protein
MADKHVMDCGHYACHLVDITYRCNMYGGCPCNHITAWCEICEVEGNKVKPDNFGYEVGRRSHCNLSRKPKDYNRAEMLLKAQHKAQPSTLSVS